MVVEFDVLECDRFGERRERLRMGRIGDARLQVEHFVHAVGRRGAVLDVAELVREPPRGVGHAGQHREEDRHFSMRQRGIADQDAKHMRVLAEHQVTAQQAGNHDHCQAERFGERADQ